ncbi:MAG TPA: DinB family protein [Saprospiraceae bacterium]|nr:DinB family protein [Saprospiraceae bacterium]
MDSSLNKILWYQFGAAIDMLENAIQACPIELWVTKSMFWYNAYHCIFYLDYYLTDGSDSFMPPAPFTLSEFDPSGLLPPEVYTKEVLLNYLSFCRNKCHDKLANMTPESYEERFINTYRNYSVLEIILYNMRHVQHHAAQLNLLLRQGIDSAPAWVSRTNINL